MKSLKYLLISVLLSVSVSSCNDGDYEDVNYRLKHVNVVSAELPNSFDFGRSYDLKATLELPNSCYSYSNQFEYFYNGTSRLVYPVAYIDDGSDACNPSTKKVEFSIPFRAMQRESYTFNFYQGKDSNGKNKFLTIEVPVNVRNSQDISEDIESSAKDDGLFN